MKVVLKHNPESNHPHWDEILDHCAWTLNDIAISQGLESGAQYLRLWIACLIRHPDEKLPYLFLIGGQNTGKSTLHEAISLLIHGVMPIDRMLRTKNFPPQGLVLGVLDEMPAAEYRGRLERHVNDGMHIIQCASEPAACPFREDDPRVTIMEVPPLLNEIKKDKLLACLNMEAREFTRTLMDLELPEIGPHGYRLPRLSSVEHWFSV